MTTICAVNRSAPTASVSGADGASTSTLDASPASLLPEPMSFSGNTVIELAMLLCKANEKDQADNLKLEDVADAAAAKDNEQRVAQMQDKAQQDATAALWTGLGEIAGGAASIGGACTSGATQGVLNGLGGQSGGAAGIGLAVSSGYKAAADHDDADAAKFQAQADADVRQYNRASNEEQAATQSIQQVQQYLQGILQTEAATNSAATGYRG